MMVFKWERGEAAGRVEEGGLAKRAEGFLEFRIFAFP